MYWICVLVLPGIGILVGFYILANKVSSVKEQPISVTDHKTYSMRAIRGTVLSQKLFFMRKTFFA